MSWHDYLTKFWKVKVYQGDWMKNLPQMLGSHYGLRNYLLSFSGQWISMDDPYWRFVFL